MEKNIILIGFMGSGKTTMGIRLSYKLRRNFLDTDKMIEKQEGRTISEIFATDGEAYFRQKETELLEKMQTEVFGKIISVGGGTPVRKENRALLHKLGRTIYLKVSPETVYERIKGDTTRPLLQEADPMAKIRSLLAQREALYEDAADVIISCDGKEFKQVLAEIMEACE